MEIDFESQTKMFLGLYERELNRHLLALCRPGFKCYDVGAQFGYDSLVLAKLSQSAVIAFECEASALSWLASNISANPGLAHLVEVWPAFVGNDGGREGHVTLDDVAYSERGFVPDFIKIDIEGAEVDALLGAQRILEVRKPGLIVETHSPALERRCQSLLVQYGYDPVIVNPRRWLPDFRPAAHNRWLVADGWPQEPRP